jgi:hypothetical protein
MNDAIESVVENKPIYEDAYVAHLKSILESITTTHSQYFSDEYLKILECLSQIQESSASAFVLIARMILRKSVWLKSTSLLHYLSSQDELTTCIQLLCHMNVFEIIQPASSFESCWEAIVSCFDMNDIKALCKSLGNLKYDGLLKEEILTKIKHYLLTQKDILGRQASSRIGTLIAQTLLKSSGGTTHVILCRLSPSILLAIRRFHRIVNVGQHYYPTAISHT